MFNESNIGGHDYLRNLVHLPFYLQNAGLRKVKTAQQAAITLKNPRGPTITSNHAAVLNWLEADDTAHNAGPSVINFKKIIFRTYDHTFAMNSKIQSFSLNEWFNKNVSAIK